MPLYVITMRNYSSALSVSVYTLHILHGIRSNLVTSIEMDV